MTIHDLMTATTAEIQEELLKRAMDRADDQIHELENMLGRMRLKQELRRRELIVTGERARRERAEIAANAVNI